MTDRDILILEARRLFCEWNATFETDPELQLSSDDTEYFYPPIVLADIQTTSTYDRLLSVHQGLNDELHEIGFIILCDDQYQTIKGLIVEADTNFSTVKEPE
jgi:hypothetical protein